MLIASGIQALNWLESQCANEEVEGCQWREQETVRGF
jgi:hypothetical protein